MVPNENEPRPAVASECKDRASQRLRRWWLIAAVLAALVLVAGGLYRWAYGGFWRGPVRQAAEEVVFLHDEHRKERIEADALYERAEAMCKHYGPETGDGLEAAKLFEKAAALYQNSGYTTKQANAILRVAWCVQPDHDKAGSWDFARDTYEWARKIYGAQDNKKGMAVCLRHEAYCSRPDINSKTGNWTKAVELYRKAADYNAETGEKDEQGQNRFSRAVCLIEGDEEKMTEEAKAEFRAAAKLMREAGNEKGAKDCEEWLETDDAAKPAGSAAPAQLDHEP